MPIIRVSADIDLDDVFDDCDDQALIEEVQRRGYSVKDCEGLKFGEFTTINNAINYLGDNGAPQVLVDQLAEWAREPIATTDRLNAWLKGCGIRACKEAAGEGK